MQGLSPTPVSTVRTFLIADIRGYTPFTADHGDEAAADLTTRFAHLVEDVVSQGGGSVLELRGDEALAAFSSSRQALRAAVALQNQAAVHLADGPEQLGIGVGIDAGEAVPVEGGYRGRALNLSARLCALAAPREILATATVINLAGTIDGIRYLDRGAAQLKGFQAPVPIWRVASREAVEEGLLLEGAQVAGTDLPLGGFLGSLPTGDLVGRCREMEAIQGVVQEVSSGAGRFVTLAGEPGAGKTRLAQELTVDLLDRGYLIGAGSCYEAQEASAFYPFTSALASLYRSIPSDLKARASVYFPSLARLIPVLPPDSPSEPRQAEDQDRLFWSVTNLLELLSAARPLALLLDDLHWADGSSLELLRYLARSTRNLPVLLLGTYRDTEIRPGHLLEGVLRDLGRDQLLQRIAVRRLDLPATAELIAKLLDAGDIAEDVARLIHARTEGNPFFVQQVVRVLREQGAVNPSYGELRRLEFSDLDVPESIRSVTAQRLSRLDPEARDVLAAASVLGQSFLFDDLLLVLQQPSSASSSRSRPDEDRLDDHLRAAASYGLVSSTNGDAWTFDHSLTREALYREIPSRRRRRLHLAAASVMAGSSERPSSERAGDIARHYLEADDPAGALPLVLLAGDQAMELSAHVEAETQFSSAVELSKEVGDDQRLARAYERLGDARLAMAEYVDAVAAFDLALETYARLGDESGELVTAVRAAHALSMSQRAEEALARLTSVIPRLDDRADAAALASAYAVQARAYFQVDRPDLEVSSALASERLARAAGDRMTLASALIDRATGLSTTGNDGEVMVLLTEAIELARELGDDVLLSRALNNAGVTCRLENGLSGSEVYHRQALEAAERSGSPSLIAHARAVLGMYAWLRGEWTESMHWFESAAGVAVLLRASTVSWTMTNPGWLLTLKGREEEATRRLQECIDWAGTWGDTTLRTYAELRLAGQDLIQGRARRASTRAETALAGEDVRGRVRTEWLMVALQAALDLRDSKTAAQLVDEVARRRIDEPWLLVDRHRLRGTLRSLTGRFHEGAACFEEGLAVARRLPNRPGEADVLRSWGEMEVLADRPAKAVDHLKAAGAIYRELGARPLLEACEVELRSLGSVAGVDHRRSPRP